MGYIKHIYHTEIDLQRINPWYLYLRQSCRLLLVNRDWEMVTIRIAKVAKECISTGCTCDHSISLSHSPHYKESKTVPRYAGCC